MPSGRKNEGGDQDREDERPRPVASGSSVQALVPGLDQPDHEPSDDGAIEVADPAEHGSRERDQSELEAGVVAERRTGAGTRARQRLRARLRGRTSPRSAAVDVDAHHRRGLGVLRNGAHRLALLRRADEPGQNEQHRDDDQKHADRVPLDRDSADRDGVRPRDEVRDGLEVDAVDREGDVLDNERHAHGRDQWREPRSVA